MARQGRIGKLATKVTNDKSGITVRLYSTDVVKVTPSKIILNSDGHRTATTKTRMNQTSNQFDLGFNVRQVGGNWVVYFKGNKIPFTDGMIIAR